MQEKDLIYDIEVYPNIFTLVISSFEADGYLTFEVSKRKNDFREMCETIVEFGKLGYRMVGFNNLAYDYPILHHLVTLWKSDPEAGWKKVTRAAKSKSNAIFSTPFDNRFQHIVRTADQWCYQVDLMKIHHFDNKARSTSLKAIEFARQAEDIGDLPYDPNKKVPEKGYDELIAYNKHDVDETAKFYEASKDKFTLREVLGEKYNRDFTNHNDGKIGNNIFVMALEEKIGKDACYYYEDGQRKIRQTKRDSINLGDVLFDYLEFETPQFKAIHSWIRGRVISETKGSFNRIPFKECRDFLFYADKRRECGNLKEVNVIMGGKYRSIEDLPGRGYKPTIIGGLKYIFGTGGLHASVEPSIWESDEEWVIIDVDVTSYYPWIAIANSVYPEHLGIAFCETYKELFDEREAYEKGTPENLSIKLALNNVYGESNSKYSPFFDSKYTMTITLNGQLSLCMLAEKFMKIDGLQILQANTDGMTARLRRKDVDTFNKHCRDWEQLTGLNLEDATYDKMFIKNVNNYIAVYDNGDVKRKGTYEYNVGWHQNHSEKVVSKAVEAHLLHGTDVREFIENHDVEYDFYLMGKCDSKSRIILRSNSGDQPLQKVNRYYASVDGGNIIKIMPPAKKKLTKKLLADFKKLGAEFDDEELKHIDVVLQEIDTFDIDSLREQGYNKAQIAAFEMCQPKEREINMCKESKVTVHNRIGKLKNVNFDYYINKAYKDINELK